MLPSGWRIMKYLARLYDIFAILAAFVLAIFFLYASRNGIHLAQFMTLRISVGNGLVFSLLLLSWHNLFVLCGLYDSKRLTPCSSEIQDVGKATLLAALFLLVIARVMPIHMMTPALVGIMWAICAALMIAGRLVARSLLAFFRRRGRNSRHLLIFGTNARAIEFADRIQNRPELGYSIVGFVDDPWEGTPKFQASGHKLCCSFCGLAEFLRGNVIDESAIFLPLRSYYELAATLVAICEQHGIVIRTDPQVFKSRSRESPVLDLDENSQVLSVPESIKMIPAAIKRAIDFVGSLVLVTLFCPVFLVSSVLVKLTSKGPVLFRQTRIGLNKRQFTIYKFRTMVADAESVQSQLLSMNEMTGPVFKIKNDPRVTSLGKFLRKTSIDELPQLFNVLKGEMSLVGPRAMSLRDYQLFDQDWHRRRFSVKPGITCLWQIHGRSSVPFEKWMELDMQYIDKWSLWLDLKILARTVPAVLRGSGAA